MGRRRRRAHGAGRAAGRARASRDRAAGLFVNPNFTLAIKGFPAQQSRDLLALLHAHTTRPEFLCRYRWRAGSLAMWDNRATMHYAVNDYGNERRFMHRVTLRGEIPFGPAVSPITRSAAPAAVVPRPGSARSGG